MKKLLTLILISFTPLVIAGADEGFMPVCSHGKVSSYQAKVYTNDIPLLVFNLYGSPVVNKYYDGPKNVDGNIAYWCKDSKCNYPMFTSKILINKFNAQEMVGFIEYKIDKEDKNFDKKAFILKIIPNNSCN